MNGSEATQFDTGRSHDSDNMVNVVRPDYIYTHSYYMDGTYFFNGFEVNIYSK